jgi:hypothetical protein
LKRIKGWGIRKGNRRGAYDQSVVEILTDEKPSNTQRRGEFSDFIYTSRPRCVHTPYLGIV